MAWALCCAGLSGAVEAGLSGLRVLSQPGQPFEAVLAIKDEVLPESAHVELADRNRYPELAPFSPAAASLHFTLVKKDTGEPYQIRVSGPAQGDETRLSFAVQVSWPNGRLLREYHVDPRQTTVPPKPPPPDDKTKKVVPHATPSTHPPLIVLGDIKLQSRLGEPLLAEVEVSGRGLDQGALDAELTLANGMAAQADWLAREPGRALLRLSSQNAMRDPILNLNLRVSHDEQRVSQHYQLRLATAPRMPQALIRWKMGRHAEPPAYYKVRKGDTLAAISTRLVGKGHPINSLMHWLVQHNPEAFSHVDAARLHANAVLRLPAPEPPVLMADLPAPRLAAAAKPVVPDLQKQPTMEATPKQGAKTSAPVMQLVNLLQQDKAPASEQQSSVKGKQAAAETSTRDALAEPLIGSAHMWNAKGHPDLAREALKRALLIKPDHPDALALLGEIELRANRPTEAFKALAKLQRLYPKHPATTELTEAYRIATRERQRMAKARQLARGGKPELAFNILQELFPDGAPPGELGIEYYSVMAQQPKLRAKALAEVEQRMRAFPNDMNYPLALAGMWADEPATRDKAIKFAIELYQRPDVNREVALRIWRRGLLSSSDTPAHLPWLEAYLLEQPYDQGLRDVFDRIKKEEEARLKREADPFWQAMQRGLKALDKNNLAVAETALAEALKGRADDPVVWGAMGRLRMRQSRHGDAITYFAKAAELDQKNKDDWNKLIVIARFWGGMAEAKAALAAGQFGLAEAKVRAAIAADPKEAEAHALLGNIYAARQNWPQAENTYRDALEMGKYNSSAMQGWVKVLNATGRGGEVMALLQRYRARYPDGRADIEPLMARALAAEADALAKVSRFSPAIAKYEAAIKLLPSDAWIRFSLAGIYRDRGVPELGREVMQDGLDRSSATEMRYASALYFSSIDAGAAALEALAGIPESVRTTGMRELEVRLKIGEALRAAQLAAKQGRREIALAALESAKKLAGDSTDFLANVGQAYVTAGLPDQGLKLVSDWLATHQGPDSLALRVRYAGMLSQLSRDEELQRWLSKLEGEPALTPEQQTDLREYRFRMVLRRVDKLQAEQKLVEAGQVLDTIEPVWGQDLRFWRTKSELLYAQQRYPEAESYARKILAQLPGDFDARLMVARIHENAGQRDIALAELKALLAETPAIEVSNRLAIERRFFALADYPAATELLQQLREQAPQDSRPPLETGRLAARLGHYKEAATWYRASRVLELPPPVGVPAQPSPAVQALEGLEARRQPMIATAYDMASKPGDPGISNLHMTEIPLYGRIPLGYDGHVFVHADTIAISAGKVPVDDLTTASLYGKIAAFGVNTLRGPLQQEARGTNFAVGYQGDNWRFDIGHTPLEFPVNYWVGGVRWQTNVRDVSYSVDVSHRPVTSSLLSFAGGRDPVSGEVWGGVRRTGITVRAGWDVGSVGFSSSAGIGVLTGENVLTNREVIVRQALDWSVIKTANHRVSIGLVANYWNYAHNQSGYTFGQGGYYSPQTYLSLGIPVEWSGRFGKLAFRLAASMASSFTTIGSTDYFPTRPNLQALAVQLANDQNLSSPTTTGSSGGGGAPGYNMSMALEYTLAKQWVIGGLYGVDRSKSYTPNRAQLYLRYYFKPQPSPVDFPPSPVRPYSRY